MKKMKIRKFVAVTLLLAVAYPVLYVGARSSTLLVRTCEAIDWTGRPSRWSNRIIPGRDFITFQLLGGLSWHMFYPAHRLETWYRNRPSYFFREAIEREKRSNQAPQAIGAGAPQPER
jgi:hypothetical protein